MNKVIRLVTIAITILFLTVTSASAFINMITKELTLPKNGSDVTLTIKATFTDVLIHEIWTDNTPTDTAGLCNNTGGFPITCTNSDYEVKSVKIAGSDFRPGRMPRRIAGDDQLAIRLLLDQRMSTDTAWPFLGASHEGESAGSRISYTHPAPPTTIRITPAPGHYNSTGRSCIAAQLTPGEIFNNI